MAKKKKSKKCEQRSRDWVVTISGLAPFTVVTDVIANSKKEAEKLAMDEFASMCAWEQDEAVVISKYQAIAALAIEDTDHMELTDDAK